MLFMVNPDSNCAESTGTISRMPHEPATDKNNGHGYDALAGFPGPLFFLHIPKTAGTTLTTFLDQLFDVQDICPARVRPELLKVFPKPLRSSTFIRGHFPLDLLIRLLGFTPTTITVFRDPVDRFISDFRHLQRIQGLRVEDTPEVLRVKNCTIESFLDDSELLAKLMFCNRHTFMVGMSYAEAFDQKTELAHIINFPMPEPDATTLAAAMERLESFAWIGQTEELTLSMQVLCHKFGWRPHKEIPRLNTAATPLPAAALSDTLRERILALNEHDQVLVERARMISRNRHDEICRDLLASFGTRSDAIRKQAPTPQRIHELLELHYIKSFRTRQTASERVSFHPDQGFSGQGWHYLEQISGAGPCRWTDSATGATLDFALEAGRDYHLTIEVGSGPHCDLLKGLRLSLNNEPLGIQAETRDRHLVLSSRIFHRLHLADRPSPARLAIQFTPGFSPNNSGAGVRNLGLLVKGITIRPAQPFRVLILADVGSQEAWHTGDEAMLEGCIQELRKREPDVDITVISKSPLETADAYRVSSVQGAAISSTPGHDLERAEKAARLGVLLNTAEPLTADDPLGPLVRAFRQTDAVIISGGGNLNAIWPGLELERTLVGNAAADRNLPVIVSGQTLGPDLTGRQKERLHRLLNRAAWIGTREERSHALALELGARPERLCTHPDDAFFLSSETNEETTLDSERPLVGITFDFEQDPARDEVFIKTLCRGLVCIREAIDCAFYFIPHTHGNRSDAALGNILLDKLGGQDFLHTGVLSGSRTAMQTRRMELVLATRYHPLVFALSGAVPVAGFYSNTYTRTKMHGVMQMLGVGAWCLPRELILTGHFHKVALELWEKRVAVRRHLEQQRPKMLTLHQRHWSNIASILKTNQPLAEERQ